MIAAPMKTGMHEMGMRRVREFFQRCEMKVKR
jgi:hypothetical protein